MIKNKRWSSLLILSLGLTLILALRVSNSNPQTARAWRPHTPHLAKLLPSDGADEDNFGSAVDLSGQTALVGAPYNQIAGYETGAAYLFEQNQGGADNWGQVTKLQASPLITYSHFGEAVAISGDTALVGAPRANQLAGSAGAAYLFERNQGGADNWGQVVQLLASDGQEGDQFGISLAVSEDGNTVVVGAHQQDGSGVDAGAAYVFGRNQGGAGNWGQVTKLTAADAEAGDRFGVAVSISGDTILVGAHEEGTSGAAYLFERDQGGPNNWGQTKKLTVTVGMMSPLFGGAVSIEGDTALVGAVGADGYSISSGAAYLFERNQGGADNWGQVKELIAADGESLDLFGYSVNLTPDAEWAVIGAEFEDDLGTAAGAAYLFKRDAGGANNWGQTEKLTAADGAEMDYFGCAVVAAGDIALVGASLDDNQGPDSGSAYVYQLVLPFDLAITKSVEPGAPVLPGSPITYTLSFSYTGVNTATGVLITDVLPLSLTQVSYTSSGAQITPTPGITFAWQVQDLLDGQGGVITIMARVPADAAPGATLVNTATVASPLTDTNTNNNQALATLAVRQFGLDLTPDQAGTAHPGDQLLYPHTLTNLGNYTDTVSVTVSSSQGWPVALLSDAYPGGTLLLPLQLGPGVAADVQVSLTVPADAAIGSQDVTVVSATSQSDESIWASATDTTTVIVVPNQAPYEPSTPSPADGATEVLLDQTLAWQGGDPDGDPVTYTVAWGNNTPPPIVATDVTDPAYDPGPLQPGTTYYWRISASDGISQNVGPIWSWETLAPPDTPTPLAPPNGSVTTTTQVDLVWQAGSGSTPDGYNLELEGDLITTTATSVSRDLTLGSHAWRVRAYNAAGYSAWSDAWTVVVTETLGPPGPPVLLSPPSGLVTSTRQITVVWQAGSGGAPTGYHLNLNGAVFTTTTTFSSVHLFVGTHIWTVRAYNAAGTSGWATSRFLYVVRAVQDYQVYLPLVLKN